MSPTSPSKLEGDVGDIVSLEAQHHYTIMKVNSQLTNLQIIDFLTPLPYTATTHTHIPSSL